MLVTSHDSWLVMGITHQHFNSVLWKKLCAVILEQSVAARN
jgi:hypothetical protein